MTDAVLRELLTDGFNAIALCLPRTDFNGAGIDRCPASPYPHRSLPTSRGVLFRQVFHPPSSLAVVAPDIWSNDWGRAGSRCHSTRRKKGGNLVGRRRISDFPFDATAQSCFDDPGRHVGMRDDLYLDPS